VQFKEAAHPKIRNYVVIYSLSCFNLHDFFLHGTKDEMLGRISIVVTMHFSLHILHTMIVNGD